MTLPVMRLVIPASDVGNPARSPDAGGRWLIQIGGAGALAVANRWHRRSSAASPPPPERGQHIAQVMVAARYCDRAQVSQINVAVDLRLIMASA